jgi:aromatic-L-amino-acid decarboxylase
MTTSRKKKLTKFLHKSRARKSREYSLRPREESLDPADWKKTAKLGHQMLDAMVDYLRTIRERPVWQRIPPKVRATFGARIPRKPQGLKRAYRDFTRYVLPYPLGNIHPRFWSWVIGTGTASGMLADMLASAMNPSLFGADHAANEVERQVLNWCKEMIGFPADSSGLLVTGGSMANLVGLAVARHGKSGYDINKRGMDSTRPRMMFYCSSETHSCVRRALEIVGLGQDSLHYVRVDENFRISLADLEAAIDSDRRAGRMPVCVVGNAGTVNTGAIDDLEGIREICSREDLWFHVDGALGGLAAISPRLRHMVRGIEKANSVAFDLHKWMFMQYDVGCVLVRDEQLHHQTFSSKANYLTHFTRGLAGGSRWLNEFGIEISRSFRALRVWMLLKEHGLRRYGRIIEQNVRQAKHLGMLIESADSLELLAPIELNVVCFRFVHAGTSATDLDALNQEILLQLQESGVAAPSSTRVNQNFALRVAITNHRSTLADFDLLVAEVVKLGRSIVMSDKGRRRKGSTNASCI